MNWIIGLQKAIDYIEDNITETIDYETVAAQSFSSSYNFQRVFSILCGFTVGEYIRCRRLSLAGAELAAGTAKVIDVALKYGYGSPDSFAKAFRKFHGILPSEARECGSVLRAYSRLVLKFSLEGGKKMNYRIETKDEMVLTGYKRHFEGVPGERQTQEKDMYVTTRPLQYILGALAGDIEKDYNVISNIGDDGYDFYIANHLTEYYRNNLEKKCILGEEFARHYENVTIPKATYAIFETERSAYPTLTFLELRRQIASEWLPSSGYQLAEAPEIVVTHWYRGAKSDDRYRELWIPIEKCE